jgi:arsenate reductase
MQKQQRSNGRSEERPEIDKASKMESKKGNGAIADRSANRERKKVLFICVHNSIRSQMAEGLLDHLYGDRYETFSAGLKPGSIHPYAIDVMAEIGIDISHHRSKSIEEMFDHYFDVVVTVCDRAKEVCPIYPGGSTLLHQDFEDPSSFDGTTEEVLESFRRVRDQIRSWVEQTFADENAF